MCLFFNQLLQLMLISLEKTLKYQPLIQAHRAIATLTTQVLQRHPTQVATLQSPKKSKRKVRARARANHLAMQPRKLLRKRKRLRPRVAMRMKTKRVVVRRKLQPSLSPSPSPNPRRNPMTRWKWTMRSPNHLSLNPSSRQRLLAMAMAVWTLMRTSPNSSQNQSLKRSRLGRKASRWNHPRKNSKPQTKFFSSSRQPTLDIYPTRLSCVVLIVEVDCVFCFKYFNTYFDSKIAGE